MARLAMSRIVRVIDGVRANIEKHDETCGDRVTGVALHPSDHDELKLVEVWGLPVLSWGEVEAGRCELLCEAKGVLTPDINTFEELDDHWTFALPRPVLGPEKPEL